MNDIIRLRGTRAISAVMLVSVVASLLLNDFWFTFVVQAIQAFVWSVMLQGAHRDLKGCRPLVMELRNKGDRMKQ